MSVAVAPVRLVPEPAAAEFAKATADLPYLFALPPAEGRKRRSRGHRSVREPAVGADAVVVFPEYGLHPRPTTR